MRIRAKESGADLKALGRWESDGGAPARPALRPIEPVALGGRGAPMLPRGPVIQVEPTSVILFEIDEAAPK